MTHRRRMMMQQHKQSTLPVGYTKLQCIVATDSQRIDTGIYANGYTGARYKFSIGQKKTYGPYILSASGFVAFPMLRNYLGGDIWINRAKGISIKQNFETDTPYEFFVDKNGDVYLNDVFITSIGNDTRANPYDKTILFGGYCDEPTNNPDYGFAGRLYYCQIFQNGEIVRDFVPCINPDGIVGLYDLVEGKFYRSNTSTDFSAGEVSV